MAPLAITAFTATTAVGAGVAALADALQTRRSGLRAEDFGPAAGARLSTWIGRVDAIDGAVDAAALPSGSHGIACRNHRLAWLALRQDGFVDAARDAIARYGASRVAVFVGTSTSTIAESERAYRTFASDGTVPPHFDHGGPGRPALHHLHATTAFVRDSLGATGPCSTVSTACSSSAKVFVQAARMIECGLIDAAVVGGVDTLASSTVFGFHALGLVSSTPCRPFDARRDGISIGEAGGFALLERASGGHEPLLVGYGESSDAHHMSSPHPEGRGARHALQEALDRAGIGASSVDYLNLHGTATPKNDAVEASVVGAMFPPSAHAHSTKGWTGHTLGAAGIVEAVVSLVAMRDGYAAGLLDDAHPDPACGPHIRSGAETRSVGIALSNAFAFGGNNCVLAFARDRDALDVARAAARADTRADRS